MRKFKKIHAAYIAGLIDGEWHVTISKRCCSTTKKGVYYSARLTVVNTNPDMITWLKDVTSAGSVHYIKSQGRRKGKWDWNCCANDTKIVLNQVMPYLVCKIKQAELVLEFIDYKHNGRGQWAARENLYLRMRNLNKKGVE